MGLVNCILSVFLRLPVYPGREEHPHPSALEHSTSPRGRGEYLHPHLYPMDCTSIPKGEELSLCHSFGLSCYRSMTDLCLEMSEEEFPRFAMPPSPIPPPSENEHPHPPSTYHFQEGEENTLIPAYTLRVLCPGGRGEKDTARSE